MFDFPLAALDGPPERRSSRFIYILRVLERNKIYQDIRVDIRGAREADITVRKAKHQHESTQYSVRSSQAMPGKKHGQ